MRSAPALRWSMCACRPFTQDALTCSGSSTVRGGCLRLLPAAPLEESGSGAWAQEPEKRSTGHNCLSMVLNFFDEGRNGLSVLVCRCGGWCWRACCRGATEARTSPLSVGAAPTLPPRRCCDLWCVQLPGAGGCAPGRPHSCTASGQTCLKECVVPCGLVLCLAAHCAAWLVRCLHRMLASRARGSASARTVRSLLAAGAPSATHGSLGRRQICGAHLVPSQAVAPCKCDGHAKSVSMLSADACIWLHDMPVRALKVGDICKLAPGDSTSGAGWSETWRPRQRLPLRRPCALRRFCVEPLC